MLLGVALLLIAIQVALIIIQCEQKEKKLESPKAMPTNPLRLPDQPIVPVRTSERDTGQEVKPCSEKSSNAPVQLKEKEETNGPVGPAAPKSIVQPQVKEPTNTKREQDDPKSGVKENDSGDDSQMSHAANLDPHSAKDGDSKKSKQSDYYKASMNAIEEPINEAVWGFSDKADSAVRVTVLEENDDGPLEETAEMLAQKKEEKDRPPEIQERKKGSKDKHAKGKHSGIKAKEKGSADKRFPKSGIKGKEKSTDKRKSGVKMKEKTKDNTQEKGTLHLAVTPATPRDKPSRECQLAPTPRDKQSMANPILSKENVNGCQSKNTPV